jgi:hypothetical protein
VACKLLVQSRADALFVAVKVHLLVELGGLLALTRQNTTFFGQQQGQELASRLGSDLSLGLWSWNIFQPCFGRSLQFFAAKSRTLSEMHQRICYD